MPDPDRGAVIARLERFEILAGAGVDMTRRSLIRSIRQIAAWLGPIGVPLVLHPPDAGSTPGVRPLPGRAGEGEPIAVVQAEGISEVDLAQHLEQVGRIAGSSAWKARPRYRSATRAAAMK